MPSRATARAQLSVPVWDATKQQAYTRTRQPVCVFHVLLDMSPSMMGTPETALRDAFNLYLAWLQANTHPQNTMEVRCFSTPLEAGTLRPLGDILPLDAERYNPRHGSGTALHHAVGVTCTTATGDGHHVLVVFTDGGDNTSSALGWDATRVQTVLTTLQAHDHWLAVFLGAMPQALEVGQAMGFAKGNCLAFPTDEIPEAFQALTQATQRYLSAAPVERKRLAAGGVFSHGPHTPAGE